MNTTYRRERELYLEIVKRSVTGLLYRDPSYERLGRDVQRGIGTFNLQERIAGRDWPSCAQTMIGTARLENIRSCIETVLTESVPGDLLEAGVWRGGAALYMRAALTAFDVADRRVWVCDSFEGMPDRPVWTSHGSRMRWTDFNDVLAVPLEEVQRNFAAYGLLDAQVEFVKGWFKSTLPAVPVQQLAVLRVDADLYESTWDVLGALYERVAVGGFVIIDDFNIPECADAVTQYRLGHGIVEPLEPVDGWAVYWQRTR